MPNLYIIAGHNGAGKSTSGRELLPNQAQNLSIFDGDVVYSQKLKEAYLTIKVHKYAVQQADEETVEEFARLTNEAIENQNDFAYEGHFSNESSWITIRTFRDKGYVINMVFLGLENLELSIDRVNWRVKKGGFLVPTYAIHHNYFGNLRFLNQNFDMLDNLTIWDTSSGVPEILLVISNHQKEYLSSSLPNWFSEFLPSLL
jgi:predicted ABC-type ATPase